MKYVPCSGKGAKAKGTLRNPLTGLGTLSVLMERWDGLNSLVLTYFGGETLSHCLCIQTVLNQRTPKNVIAITHIPVPVEEPTQFNVGWVAEVCARYYCIETSNYSRHPLLAYVHER